MLIFLDTETTGVESQDVICSIALVAEDAKNLSTCHDLVFEGKKIPPEASAIHHITNEMLQGKSALKESKSFAFLQEHNLKTTTIIGHNVLFDLEKLMACGFVFQGDIVDTLRCSRHLMSECDAFSLQFLRYDLKLYKQEKELFMACGIDIDANTPLQGHHAIVDAVVVKLLFETLLELAPLEELKRLSHEKVLLQKLSFGKHRGKFIEEIAMSDRAYLEWLLAKGVDLDEDLRYSIDYHLQGYV